LLAGFAVNAAEPTQTFTDDLGRKVVVPVHPKRIVSLHDLDITIPLIELGVPPSPATDVPDRTAAIFCAPAEC
jgi:iron complex transport system substrate-binding protein